MATKTAKTPIRDSRIVHLDSGEAYTNRLLIGTPTRGTVRIEWASAMRSMAVPPNWSSVNVNALIDQFIPIRFAVAHGQNLIARHMVERDYEWLLLLEDDVVPPTDILVKMARYIKEGPPVVSGLYYLKGRPTEPIVYRGGGNGAFDGFKVGDKVWVDGVPTGCLLVHGAIIREMWKESEEYVIAGQTTRKVFETPVRSWINPNGDVNTSVGTSDLDWCARVIAGDYLRKAGWPQFARRKYPFLVDTTILCNHIAPDGTVYP